MLARALARLALGVLPAFAPGTDAAGVGAVAPAGTWYTRGGCAARTGVAATVALRTEPTVRWKHVAGGAIDAEPLVWGGHVVLEVVRRDGARRLESLALASGKVLATSAWFDGLARLEPGLWGGRIVARTARDRLSGLRVSGAQIASVWTYEDRSGVVAPLFYGNEVYYRTRDGALARTVFGSRREQWRARGRFRGELALRGSEVCALEYDGGRASLVALDRSSGKRRDLGFAGHHRGGTEPAIEDASGVVLLDGGRALVQHVLGVPLSGGGDAHSVWLAPGADAAPLLFGRVPVAAPGATVIGFTAGDAGLPSLLEFAGADQVPILASGEHHPEFVRRGVPVSIAGGVGSVGAAGFDLDTKRILFDLAVTARFRAVPVHAGLLLVEGESTLLLVGSAQARAPRRIELCDWSQADERGRLALKSGAAVLADGSVRRAPFQLDRQLGARFPGADQRPAAQVGLGDLSLVEDGRATILVAAGAEAAVVAVRALLEDELARRFTDLAVDACPARDPLLVERILSAARLHGSGDPRLDRAQETADRIERDGLKPDPARVRAIEKREQELLALEAQGFLARAERLPPAAPRTLRAALLAAALGEDPALEAAARGLRELVPPGLAGLAPADVPELLDALDALPIDVVRPGSEPDRAADARATTLSSFRDTWRPDLCALGSANLLILATPERAHVAARCLQSGEVVCRALRELFPPESAAEQPPLVLLLYPTRDEYLAAASGGHAGGMLAQSAGCYDSQLNLTRVFVPDGKEAITRLVATYAHELTHHWLAARWIERADAPTAARRIRAPGYWIVEGLACLVAEMVFDLEAGTWRHAPGAADSLMLLADARDVRRPFTWTQFFAQSQLELNVARSEQLGRVTLRTHLGQARQVDTVGLYYAYAASAAHHLFAAENGARRERLVAYARSWYRGEQRQALDAGAAFGLDPEELGRQIEAWARSAAGGD